MDWRDRARRQAGVISREQLAASGLSEHRMDGLVRRRELCEVLPFVYSPRPVPASIKQRLWAAVLWSGGVISHRSAAALWKLPIEATAIVHVTVADRKYRKAVPGVRPHRVPLARVHHVLFDGLPVTDRVRTLVDLLRTERLGVARRLLDRALQQDWLGEYDVEAAYRGEPGRTGNGQLRCLLAELEPGAQAESERRMHRLLRSAGITGWTPQYQVRLPRSIALLDIVFPEQKLAIEVDGRRYHDDRSDRFETDRERQNDLVALGWRVIRVTWTMLTQRPHAVLAQIAQLLAA